MTDASYFSAYKWPYEVDLGDHQTQSHWKDFAVFCSRAVFTNMDLIISRACERLKQMRIQQARPDPEKAAKMQELHRKLRVCFKFFAQLC